MARGGLRRTGLLRILEELPTWQGVLVLNYHRIGDAAASPLDRGLFSATPEEFDRQARHLSRHADVIRLADAPAALEAGHGRNIVLTFDDGYRDNHEHALPVLRAHGLPATFFLATGFLDRPTLPWWDEAAWALRSTGASRVAPLPGVLPQLSLTTTADRERAIVQFLETYKVLPAVDAERALAHVREAAAAPQHDSDQLWMTWDMARELVEAGMDVGGHTVHHPVLANVDDGRLERELDGCATRLREELGLEMTMFAYPVGRPESYDQRAVDQLTARGVQIACAFSGGYARPGGTDLMRFPRASVSADMSLSDVRLRVAAPARFARW